jgi:hypothetical protein
VVNDIMRERILRRLEGMPDERAYQVIDYIEFLETKYGTLPRDTSAFQKLAERVEDTLRAGRLSASAVKSTMDAVDAAGRMMRGLAAAGKAAVDQMGSRPADKTEGAGKADAVAAKESTKTS